MDSRKDSNDFCFAHKARNFSIILVTAFSKKKKKKKKTLMYEINCIKYSITPLIRINWEGEPSG